MGPLSEITQVPVQDELLERWIIPDSQTPSWDKSDTAPYRDGTYDWYAGMAAFAQPSSILEIGVFRGYSLVAMLSGLDYNVRSVVGVDAGIDAHADMTSVALLRIKKEFDVPVVRFINVDTQGERWADVPPGPYEIVHVDADHSYPACLNDLNHYGPMVTDTGIIIVHDTNDPNVHQACMRFINERGLEFREIATFNGNIVMRRKVAG